MPGRPPTRGPTPPTLVLGAALASVAAVSSGPATAAPALAPSSWAAGLFNPKPLPDDLILPLPCGGALAFRPVATPVDGSRAPLIGPFSGAGDGERYLLIGKYEVTALQYRTVMAQGAGQGCPTTGAAAPPPGQVDPRVVAQVGVSRIDAVNFAAQLSRWLQTNAARIPACAGGPVPCLPRVDGKAAFVRLPTDLEWEYAARGGVRVSDEAFARPRYPMPEGLDRHAWYNRNADGELAPIGARLPNPLGLHDLYGNASELMNDPYSSTRFPGQIGGDVLMGGGIHSSDADLRADQRLEVPPYDAAGDVKTADTGFRVVLAAPVVTSTAKLPAAPAVAAPAPPPPGPPAPPPPGPPAAPAPPPVLPADGQLRVQVNVAAMIDVDGVPQGAAGLDRPLDLAGLSRGSHRIAARAAGDRKATTTVDLSTTAAAVVRLQLDATPVEAERLLGLTPAERLGVREQLRRLGYPCNLNSEPFDPDFRAVLSQFQHHAKLPATGYLSAETRTLLGRRVAERQRPPTLPGRPQRPAAAPPRAGGAVLQFPDRAADEAWMDPDVP